MQNADTPNRLMCNDAPANIGARDGWTGLALLVLVSFSNYLDRMVLPAVAQPIKEEFGLSDAQLGLATGIAFVLLYAFAGIPIARLADARERRTILAVAVAFWSMATAACGLVKSFWHLLLARMSVGIGEAACQPIGYALLADYFPPERRATVMGWFMVGNSLGIMAGFALGGWIAAELGWRMAFIVIGLPGVLLALAVRLVMREPPRTGLRQGTPAGPLSTAAAFRILFTNRAFVWITLANMAYAMMLFGPLAWLPAFFVRTHELSLAVVGTWTGIGVGIGMALGMIIGGPWSDRLLRGGHGRPLMMCAAASLVAGSAYLVAFWSPDATIAFAAVFLAAAAGALCAPTNVAALQNVCDPRLRATAGAVLQVVSSLFGVGCGPFIIGLLSDWFETWASGESLRLALTSGLVACLFAAAAYRLSATAVQARAEREAALDVRDGVTTT